MERYYEILLELSDSERERAKELAITTPLSLRAAVEKIKWEKQGLDKIWYL